MVYYQLFRFLAIVFTVYKPKLGFFDIIDITSLLCASNLSCRGHQEDSKYRYIIIPIMYRRPLNAKYYTMSDSISRYIICILESVDKVYHGTHTRIITCCLLQ
jgi:hypothetical protein